MGFIVDGEVTVEAGEGRTVSRMLEFFHIHLKGALLAALLVTTDTILRSVCLGEAAQKTADRQSAPQKEPNSPQREH
jgi:hypothetical protein